MALRCDQPADSFVAKLRAAEVGHVRVLRVLGGSKKSRLSVKKHTYRDVHRAQKITFSPRKKDSTILPTMENLTRAPF